MAVIRWFRRKEPVRVYEPDATQRWAHKRLMVLDHRGWILFNGYADIRFESSGTETPIGLAETDGEPNLHVVVDEWESVPAILPWHETGIVLTGVDATELPRVWLIDSAVGRYRRKRALLEAIARANRVWTEKQGQ